MKKVQGLRGLGSGFVGYNKLFSLGVRSAGVRDLEFRVYDLVCEGRILQGVLNPKPLP